MLSSALAATETWTGTGANPDFSTVGNWSGGVAPGATSGTTDADTAIFSSTPVSGYGLTGNPLVIDTPYNLENLTFTSASAGAFVIGSTSGNALTLTTGGTIQNASSVINAEKVNAPLTLVGNYTFSNSAALPTATLTIGGAITGPGTAGTLTLSGSNSGDNLVSGLITTGAAALSIDKTGPGTWDITGNNSGYTGTTSVGVVVSGSVSGGVTTNATATGGVLSVGNANALGTGTTVTIDGGALAADSGGVTLSNNVYVVADLATASSFVGSNNITIGSSTAGLGGTSSASSGTLILGESSANGVGSSSASTDVLVNNLSGGATLTVAGVTYLSGSSTTRPQTIASTGNTVLWDIDGGAGFGNSTIASSLAYGGSGTLTLDGTNYSTGGLTLGSGTVILNYAAATSEGASARLNATGSLTLGGVNLELNGDSGTPFTEVVGTGGTVLKGGSPSTAAQTNITSNNGSVIELGAITGNGLNVAINFQPGVATTTTANASSGILGAYATVGSGSTYDWAVSGASNTTPISAYSNYSTTTGTGGGTSNYLINSSNSIGGVATAAYLSVGTLKIDSGTDTGSDSLTLTSTAGVNFTAPNGGGGILYTGSANYTIFGNGTSGGNGLSSGTNQTGFIIQQYGTGTLTLDTPIIQTFDSTGNGGNGINTAPGAPGYAIRSNGVRELTKAGTGLLVLAVANNYGGSTYIDEGTLSISSDADLGGISGTVTIATGATSTAQTLSANPSVSLDGATLLGTTVSSVNGTAIVLGASETSVTGTTYAYANGTQALVISNATLEATSTFSLSESATATAGTVTNNRPVEIGSGGATIDVTAGNTLTIPGIVSNSGQTANGGLTKTDSGILALSGVNTYNGTTTVAGGTLLANATGSNSSTGTGSVVVMSGAILGGSGNISPSDPLASIIIQSGGILHPGITPLSGTAASGNLTLTAASTVSPTLLTLNSGAQLIFTLGSGSTSSELVLATNAVGEVAFNSNAVTINDLTSGALTLGDYLLIVPTTSNSGGSDFAGLTLNGTSASFGGVTGFAITSGLTFSAPGDSGVLFENASNGDIEVDVLAIPEPNIAILVLFGSGLLLLVGRRNIKLQRS